MISKGFLYHIIKLKDLDSENAPIELDPVVKEFLTSFLWFSIIPPEWEIDFGIYLLRDTNPIQFLIIGWLQPNWKS